MVGLRGAVGLGLLLAAGCGGPSFADGDFLCDEGACPPGFICDDGVCVRTVAQEPAIDAPTPDGDDGSVTGGDAPPEAALVWAHTTTQLYRIDPASMEATEVGAFTFSDGAVTQIWDLARAPDGRLVGVTSANTIYSIGEDGTATRVGMLPTQMNSLAYVPEGDLIAATPGGGVYRIDSDWVVTKIGDMLLGDGASGDLVWDGARERLLATVWRAGLTDLLAEVDAATGVATEIGDTGGIQLYGLSAFDGRIVAFGVQEIRELDPATGVTNMTTTSGGIYYGAATAP